MLLYLIYKFNNTMSSAIEKAITDRINSPICDNPKDSIYYEIISITKSPQPCTKTGCSCLQVFIRINVQCNEKGIVKKICELNISGETFTITKTNDNPVEYLASVNLQRPVTIPCDCPPSNQMLTSVETTYTTTSNN